ncbi:PREDICTED: RING-H2 finger protein ATL14 [Camelina sativa]|uniref:RING-type E3 ubiquitin transferase n=1 Tax=Camelina sativa TaxID=90675 RepID=A0ABM0UA71_CAMSA|nr:PREDICTED: RING-H2 finger protein ATL14 [Camelina sativa]
MSIPIPYDVGSISGETSPSPPPPKANTKNLPTKILSNFLVGLIMIPVAVTAFLFILTSLGFTFFFAFYWFLHRNYRHRLRRHRRHEYSDGLSPRCVKRLPQFKFREPVTEYGSDDCVVCIDGFRQGQWCRKLPRCGHVFHRKCVDLWLMKVPTCPICRDRVYRFDEGRRWRPEGESFLNW